MGAKLSCAVFLIVTLALALSIITASHLASNETAAKLLLNLTQLSVVQPNSLSAIAGLDDQCTSWRWPHLKLGIQIIASSGRERCSPYVRNFLFTGGDFNNYSIFEGSAMFECVFESLEGLEFFTDIDGNVTCGSVAMSQLVPVCHERLATIIDLRGENVFREDAASICANNFSIAYSYHQTCLVEHMYGPMCSVYCKPVRSNLTCYDCLEDGTKLCCPLFQGEDCSPTPAPPPLTTTPSVIYVGSTDDNLWRILTIVFATLTGLLLIVVLVFLVVVLRWRKEQRKQHIQVYPYSEPEHRSEKKANRKKGDSAEQQWGDSGRETQPPPPQVTLTVRENNPNRGNTTAQATRSIGGGDPLYTEIRKIRRPASNNNNEWIPDSEPTMNPMTTNLERPSRDDPRRRPIIGTPQGSLWHLAPTHGDTPPRYDSRPVE